MSHGCKLEFAPAVFLACALAACALRPAPPAGVVSGPAPPPPPIARTGRPYDVVGEQSLLTLRVYRGGTLASAGHNHLIASHALAGTVYLPDEVLGASFELHLAVAELTVDERELRAREPGSEFPPDVPQSARDGTRRNMLGPAVLDADDYPEVVLQSVALERATPAQPGALTASIAAKVRGQWHTVHMPLHYALAAGTLTVSGEAPLRQSELGLTPFTALMGALAVQDEMLLKVHIVARAAETAH